MKDGISGHQILRPDRYFGERGTNNLNGLSQEKLCEIFSKLVEQPTSRDVYRDAMRRLIDAAAPKVPTTFDNRSFEKKKKRAQFLRHVVCIGSHICLFICLVVHVVNVTHQNTSC